jgi:hypothetical protein
MDSAKSWRTTLRPCLTALRYAVPVLDRIDQTQRITHVALSATLAGGDTVVWRTQREQNASPHSYSLGGFDREERKRST